MNDEIAQINALLPSITDLEPGKKVPEKDMDKVERGVGQLYALIMKRPPSKTGKLKDEADALEKSCKEASELVAAAHKHNIGLQPTKGEEFLGEKSLPKEFGRDSDSFERTGRNDPKAGFEAEWNSILVYDSKEGNASTPAARYRKRAVLFESKHGYWTATADSTLKECSNLEVLFGLKGLSKDVWANQDDPTFIEEKQSFEAFIEWVKTLPEKKPIDPMAFGYDITIKAVNVRLMRRSAESEPQFQMTSADPLPEDRQAWLPPGFHPSALPTIKTLVESLKKDHANHPGENPKNYLGDILKTPVLHLLGKLDTKSYSQEGLRELETKWVDHMCQYCVVNPDAEVAESLVMASMPTSGKPTGAPTFKLRPTGFRWRYYFSELLHYRDPINDWASSAFKADGDDIGLGQIEDADLPVGFGIFEHRKGIDRTNYLAKAKKWADDADQTLRKQ